MEHVSRPHARRFDGQVEYDPPTGFVHIGVVVPFDFGIDWHYWHYVPEGVSLYFTRTPHSSRAVGVQLARDVSRPHAVARATRALTSLDPAAVIYACSSGSFVRGLAGEAELRDMMLRAGAPAAVTSSGAMLDALNACDVRRVSVATPYTKRLTSLLVTFLEEAGYEVTSAVYLGLDRDMSRVNKTTISELLRGAAHPDADAVFLSCTALKTLGTVAAAEQQIGIPILTSNQVTLWAGLCAARVPLGDDRASGPVLGDASPVARSTAMLLAAAEDAVKREAG